MDEENILDLQRAVESQHHCEAHFHKTASVHEEFMGQTVWKGDVHIFDIDGHSEATTCYVWSSLVENSEKRRIYAVLNVPPVNSAAAAVRASIVADNKHAK